MSYQDMGPIIKDCVCQGGEVMVALGRLDDDELNFVESRLGEVMPLQPEKELSFADPIGRFNISLKLIFNNEWVRRSIALHQMRADLNGGHLVEVNLGSRSDKYRAICDPDPRAEGSCYCGPDRETIEEAKKDGLGHWPRSEPQIGQDVDLLEPPEPVH